MYWICHSSHMVLPWACLKHSRCTSAVLCVPFEGLETFYSKNYQLQDIPNLKLNRLQSSYASGRCRPSSCWQQILECLPWGVTFTEMHSARVTGRVKTAAPSFQGRFRKPDRVLQWRPCKAAPEKVMHDGVLPVTLKLQWGPQEDRSSSDRWIVQGNL